jgi:hypothetical protein
MIEGLDGSMEMVDISLDERGEVLPPKHDKKIIMDADTLVYGAATKFEEEVPVWLEEDSYEEGTTWVLDEESAKADIKEKIEYILNKVGGKVENLELHFTGTPYSFRYALLADAFPEDESMWYKAKRKSKHKPPGLKELKEWCCEVYPHGIIHHKWEADDAVTLRMLEEGDNAILAAVDKDVLYNLPGRHFNYYSSQRYGIDMTWVNVSPQHAQWHKYYQTIVGDKSDNVPGLPGIGPKKAKRFLDLDMEEKDMWQAVLSAYNKHCKYGDPEEMAILNHRLIRMDQLVRKDNGCQIELWEPTKIQ